MTSISYRIFRMAAGLAYHLPRRLTKAGLLALLGIVLTGAVGTDLDQSVAFQGFALLACLMAVGWGMAPFFRGRFQVERVLPRLASVGQRFRYRVDVRNKSARSYPELEVLEDLAEPYPSFQEFARRLGPGRVMRNFRLAPRAGVSLDMRPAVLKPAFLSPLAPHGFATTEVEVLPLRRGPLRLRGTTLSSRDPFGMVRRFVRIALPQSVLVLPKRYRIPKVAFPGTRQYQPGGVALASSIGESEEFVSLRDYRPGDAFRRIHWRSSARAGRPIVKECQDEFFVRHGLVLDTCGPAWEVDRFEEAVSLAASFACTLDTQESLLDFLFVGAQAFSFTAGRGVGQSEQILEILASVQLTEKARFTSLTELVLRHAALLSSCICVFIDWDEARRDLVRKLRGAGLPVLTFIVAEESLRAKINRDPERDFGVHLLRPGSVEQDLRQLDAAETL